jgi:ubiquinone/menaquinone biosynthesis C-methylase UbiE
MNNRSGQRDTSWQSVHRWYNKTVGSEGSFYHKEVVLPGTMRLLDIKPSDSILDLACGQGVLERKIPKVNTYVGLDLAPGLLDQAQKQAGTTKHTFKTQDVSKPFQLKGHIFTKATIILGLQNLESPKNLFINASKHLDKGGQFLIVINHPYFRIPRQTSWSIDPKNKLQSRLVSHYMSPLKIPINMNPSRGSQGKLTWSFHFSLQDYTKFLSESGFQIKLIEEWTSPKESQGKFRKMENHSRDEFPLFMAILAQKV